ncbi:MAG: hypothetical protein ACR2JV_01995 [Gaiellales bacterium]
MSLFAVTAANMVHDIAVGNERGKELVQQLEQRVIEGSAEHNFGYWQRLDDPRVLLREADEELIDAIVYLALWYMQRGRTI